MIAIKKNYRIYYLKCLIIKDNKFCSKNYIFLCKDYFCIEPVSFKRVWNLKASDKMCGV